MLASVQMPTPSVVNSPFYDAIPLGEPIPPNEKHAVSVSLPRWQDVVDYEEGRISDILKTGYPRFFIHRSIQQLANVLKCKFGRPDEQAILFPSMQSASECRDFIREFSRRAGGTCDPQVRIVRFCVLAQAAPDGSAPDCVQASNSSEAPIQLHCVLFPGDLWPHAKAFWQHTGLGISSRLADECLRILAHNESILGGCSEILKDGRRGLPAVPARGGGFGRSRYQRPMTSSIFAPASSEPSRAASPAPSTSTSTSSSSTSASMFMSAIDHQEDELTVEHAMYVEERFGRNLPFEQASLAKCALRRRIAGTLLSSGGLEDALGSAPVASVRHGGISEDDVYLFATGMASIYSAHQVAMLERAVAQETPDFTPSDCEAYIKKRGDLSFVRAPFAIGKAICFGFPYTDTLKILQKWGPGCHFFGHGTDKDLDALEEMLENYPRDEPPVVSLFCEFPSNPLLRSADLVRLRRLADKHGFVIVIDETIGNFVNVDVLPYADMVVSSLTKVFSGECNVMGGSLVLNPKSARAATLRNVLKVRYEDTQWPEDSIFLERNSRDFVPRVARIDTNAEAICEYLLEAKAAPNSVVRDVFYPKYVTRNHYDACRRTHQYASESAHQGGGFGGLFSVVLKTPEAARAFYDALSCAKGPSLGTSCTLACPYTLLAHYAELPWAKTMEVDEELVRVSVGCEETDTLIEMCRQALEAASSA
ncbi:cystathionine gamma-synthase [Malassezia cuniculi]|uniref:Cystathionine gamma-synthase n=1 Tax=Malassezia cuniculi TaxID=948313 RepID=A0AAF0JB08_9BASI|nr:cystathionine gamma-synthase [Malassezia cuniculi]